MGFMENLLEGGKMRLVSKLSRVDWPYGYMRYCTLFVIILVNLDIWCQKIARVGKCEMVYIYIYILVLCCILVKLIFCCKPVQLHADEIRKCPALKSQTESCRVPFHHQQQQQQHKQSWPLVDTTMRVKHGQTSRSWVHRTG